MKLKLQTLGRSDGFNKLMSSLISILVGLLVGGIVVLIVGLVEPKITGSGIWYCRHSGQWYKMDSLPIPHRHL